MAQVSYLKKEDGETLPVILSMWLYGEMQGGKVLLFCCMVCLCGLAGPSHVWGQEQNCC